MTVGDKPVARESGEEDEASGADAGRKAAIGCFVLAGAVLALGIVLGAALMLTSVIRNPADEVARPEVHGLVMNQCESAIRAGWVLSDTAAPFRSEDAAKFFLPLKERSEDADSPATENQTRLIAPGTSAPLGLGRPGGGERERILLIQTLAIDSGAPGSRAGAGDLVLAYSLKPVPLDVTDGVVPLVISGEGCVAENLEQVSLG